MMFPSLVPRKFFLTRGVGEHRDKLQSFELALRDAGIAEFNLVKVSSIIPPNCELISKEEGLKMLKPGQIVFCVLSYNASNEKNRLLSASIGCALPKDKNMYGYLSEFHAFGLDEKEAGEYAEDLAATMLATRLGIKFDPAKNWDEKKQAYLMSGKIIYTTNITQTAIVRENGVWTTVIAAAVFIL